MTRREKDQQIDAAVRTHHSGLRYFIRSLGVSDAWVDDLAQETFLIAHRKWEELDHPDQAPGWLRQIARNLVMNELTKTGRRQRLLDEKVTTLLIQADSPVPAPGALQDAEIRHEALRECLDGLPGKVRSVINARYYDDRNATEIGEELSMNPAAVRKLLYLARKTLAECLASKQIHASS
ncbi:sigma-70 family RNA polymerase sigma factor [Luteolibacter sp. GHJ8]|uniref:Sigma-70 family RNA polymerase sigma factor n=1 Tax=Luteolibacter rhizosphaerae TaxID=2989719 RepID=A0ABT3G5U3_9BACT|nr:sigma-70 family RNA polymerase sigma factor [Luteolibacter rhizosphaerae]MCW1915208.1 sigma-70 family RNA polymerase sigma factor [Luteolibacter rhizosphaerae]